MPVQVSRKCLISYFDDLRANILGVFSSLKIGIGFT